MKLNDIEVNFSLLNGDDWARYEDAQKYVDEESGKALKKGLPVSEEIKAECRITDKFFDMTFGEGTSEKLFKGSNDFKIRLDLYQQVVKEFEKEGKSYEAYTKKYSPNRVKRTK